MAIHLDIPGRGPCTFEHLVLDLNGTLALNGDLLPGVADRLASLSPTVCTIHLLTADTGGNAAQLCVRLSIPWTHIEPGAEASQKQVFIKRLGAAHVVAVGNGVNDARTAVGRGPGRCSARSRGVGPGSRHYAPPTWWCTASKMAWTCSSTRSG